LLIIAVFVVRFLAIHPFHDGNGRLSRALTTLLLLRSGYRYVPYSSLERIVEDSKDEYYMALRRAQATLDEDQAQLIQGPPPQARGRGTIGQARPEPRDLVREGLAREASRLVLLPIRLRPFNPSWLASLST
jgi:hypothetical protein